MDQDQAQKIADLIRELINKMGVDANVEAEDGVHGKIFNISSPDSNLLIGQHGANLYALQILAHAYAFKNFSIAERFGIDVDDYRRKSEWYLRETAKKALEQMKRTHRPVALEPMPAYERRVIHAYLSEDFSVDTESIGYEPNRRIVIKPKEKGSL
jgi:spoIIIJ-associated protein